MEPQTQLKFLNARIQGDSVSTLTVLYAVQHRYEQKDKCAWQSPMETVTLIIPLDATAVKNPRNIKSYSGATAGVTVEEQQERW